MSKWLKLPDDDDPVIDDEPPWGSFPEEHGWPDLEGMPFSEAVKEVNARFESWIT